MNNHRAIPSFKHFPTSRLDYRYISLNDRLYTNIMLDITYSLQCFIWSYSCLRYEGRVSKWSNNVHLPVILTFCSRKKTNRSCTRKPETLIRSSERTNRPQNNKKEYRAIWINIIFIKMLKSSSKPVEERTHYAYYIFNI